ncbi:YbhB/YbcL family Raf kinase inhibitor-like protein [Natrarchaeobius chitinivorans]|uniref:YbhB/YbcL family Raf kinase inhibitor-like protein n=1 Tax=Natrarchaeobius chitinivorans TaxID=1679083 RepID=A0A3N6MKV2_NATCH|nr:YbhB/YbcL family Raf kinase inhibitor-like protein [Natrarchaeobius chitinivorans]RQG94926.1 YbhB/YbcL family Raf kinase inhibitor-like protein [Natrarchaeobius chitinivorans]
MTSLLDPDIEQLGDLSIEAPDFDDGERMPDYVGFVNEDENPELRIENVPKEAESLILICDDPDARGAVGFTYDHWLVWNIDPDIETIPRGWNPSSDEATVGYNDFVQDEYNGPSPPDGTHGYRFKLVALDTELDLEPEARKAVVQLRGLMEGEVLAATQIVGEYDPSQGTAF